MQCMHHNFLISNTIILLYKITQNPRGHNLKLKRVTNCATIICVYNSTAKHMDHIHEGDSHGVQLRESQNTTESPHSAQMFVIIVILKSASI